MNRPPISEPASLKILIVRVGAMGDVLHGMPAVAGLRAALPNCRIGWAIEPAWMPLLRRDDGAMPLVDRVHAVPAKDWKRRPVSLATGREIVALRRDLRAADYDVCVDLQGSIRSSVIGRMAAAKLFVGPAEPREPQATLLYTERVPFTRRNVIEQACELVSVAVSLKIEPATIELPRDANADAWCDGRIRGRFVLIAPTAGWGAKEWGAERYIALANGLRSAGWRVLVNAAPSSGSPVAEEIAAASGAELMPSTLPQLIALTRRASLVIGGDTGPVHLAAALGKPTLALFGPTDPARNGPAFVGAKVRVLRDAASVTDHRRGPTTEAGLGRIKVEEVLAHALAMLEEEPES